ncbi:hypothetical protein QUC31_019128 [Theobroma cacao]|uniref:Uncharacterized protein LOC18590085 n=2 Tax=Theobroma cacao TaxID=3641 RepID=A0AB32URZ3_THECC|nr:PREDICTED: uncharacterized protein LOC18590085 [Theobroma cacao]EOY33081.1 Uncharacterized protein TCM_041077 [Theobroma cacao]WRX32152.1 hypothetical protein QQP08_024639 [Theobroma cacao]WRX33486.1 hypothetical protein QQP08_025973 [Theobroma cacao]
MQSMLNLHTTYGLPLCVSGITKHFILSEEMADHDRRREAMKKKRSRASESLHADREMGIQENFETVVEQIMEGEVDGDGAIVLQHLSCSCLACTAKAA